MDVLEYFFKNKGTKQTIIKNTFWAGLSQFICSLIKTGFVFYMARVLGVLEYGRMNAALSFAAMFLIFADLGLSTTAMKEMGRTEDKKVINDIFSLRFTLNLVSFIIAFVAALYFSSDFYIVRVIWIFALFNLINGLTAIISSYFVAKQHAQYNAFFDIGNAIISTTLGFVILQIHPTATSVAISYCAGALFSLLGVFILFRKIYFSPKLYIDAVLWKEYLIISLPFAIAGLFSSLCANIDIFVMGFLKQYEAIGLYSSAIRITSVAIIPVTLVAGNFFPALNSLFVTSNEKYKKVLDAEFEISILLSIAIAYGGNLLAAQIIDFVYDPRFAAATIAFKVFAATLIPMLFANTLSHVLVIENKKKFFVWAWAANFFTNFVLDIILIPKYFHLGGAIASLVANSVFAIVMFIFAQQGRRDKVFSSKLIFVVIFSIVSCAIMHFALVRTMVHSLNVALLILLGGIVYLTAYALQRRLFFGSFTG